MWDTNPNPSNMPTNVYVGKVRKDGKHKTTLCYTARNLTKLFTAEQVAEYVNNDNYKVIYK